jgi:Skp family chaperone for outer membrane proteins
MRQPLHSLLPSLTLLLTFALIPPAYSQKAATSQNVKIGYFNLNIVRMSDPQVGNSEQLKIQAENQLKNDLDEGNKKVQKMKDEKKSEEEIKKTIEHLQVEITAKTQALTQLVQNNNALAQEKLRQVVTAVAKDRGLDIVVDGSGVYAGGQKIVDNGIDVTDDLVKKFTGSTSVKSSAK